jgi:hypothetical protein
MIMRSQKERYTKIGEGDDTVAHWKPPFDKTLSRVRSQLMKSKSTSPFSIGGTSTSNIPAFPASRRQSALLPVAKKRSKVYSTVLGMTQLSRERIGPAEVPA